MVICPKCGFQQPKDRYCARCGVDMEVFVPPRKSASSLLTGILKPLLIFASIILVLFFLLKLVTRNLNVDFDFISSSETETSTIGAQATSVRVEAPVPARPSTASASQAARTAPVPTPKEKLTPEPQPLPEQLVTVSLAEIAIPESSRGNFSQALVSNEPQILNTFYSETLPIYLDPVTFRFEDEFLIYEMTVTVNSHQDEKNTFRLSVRRTLKSPTADIIPALETSETLALPGYASLIDTLPRDQRLRPVSNVLNALAQSQSYLARTSELAIVLRFESVQAEVNP